MLASNSEWSGSSKERCKSAFSISFGLAVSVLTILLFICLAKINNGRIIIYEIMKLNLRLLADNK